MSGLVRVLENQECRDFEAFERFLQQYYPDYAAAPQFYLSCLSFKRDQDEKRRGKIARGIYAKFLRANLSISPSVQQKLDQIFQSTKPSLLYNEMSNPDVFSVAHREIFTLMDKTLFPHFLALQQNQPPQNGSGYGKTSQNRENVSALLQASCSQILQKGQVLESRIQSQTGPQVDGYASSLTRKNLFATSNQRDRSLDVWQMQPQNGNITGAYHSKTTASKPSISAPDSTVSMGAKNGAFQGTSADCKSPSSRSLPSPSQRQKTDAMSWDDIKKLASLNRTADGLQSTSEYRVVPPPPKPTLMMNLTQSFAGMNVNSNRNAVKEADLEEEDESERILGEHCDRIWNRHNADSPTSIGSGSPSPPSHTKQQHQPVFPNWNSSFIPAGNVVKVDYDASNGCLQPQIQNQKVQRFRPKCGMTTDSGVGGSGASHVSSSFYAPRPMEEKKPLQKERELGHQIMYKIGRNGEFFMPAKKLAEKTLKCFKNCLPQDLISGKEIRYFFKESIPGVGMVWKEVIHSKEQLPEFEGRIVAILE